MRSYTLAVFAATLAAFIISQTGGAAALKNDDVQSIVTQAVRPVMKQYGIPGMAVGVTVDGRHYVFESGVASEGTGKRVDDSTLFEIGSITKTFTASLVSYAQLTGKLSLSDAVSARLPSLRGSSFDDVRLVNLGTHTAGGLPLQFPDDVQNDDDAIKYYQRWKPSHPAGAYRLYSNPSIMLLGLVAAKSMNADFATLMQRELFAPLGLRSTFLTVPEDQLSRYAQGYTKAGNPRRMSPGPLAAEAYGIRTTAPDLLRFVDANMNLVHLDDTLRRAIVGTHTGYYRIGGTTQDLIWEQYALSDPVVGFAGRQLRAHAVRREPGCENRPAVATTARCRDKQDGTDERLRGVRRVHSATKDGGRSAGEQVVPDRGSGYGRLSHPDRSGREDVEMN